jgi:hypothetical protein
MKNQRRRALIRYVRGLSLYKRLLPDKPRVCLYSPYLLIEQADEKLIILLFLEASNNDLVLFYLVPKITKDKYSFMFQEVS